MRILFICCLLAIMWLTPSWADSGTKLDVVLVLDNSGSMRKNDPERLLRQVVRSFAAKLNPDDRLGIITFDQISHLVLPLSSPTDANFSEQLNQAIDKIDYSGQHTDIPGGVEEARHLIELHGRNEAKAIILLLTDGSIDLGSESRNSERKRWLLDSILPAAKNQKLRLFGITLTADADVELIQSMAEATGGEYYRLLHTDEISANFDAIFAHVLALQAKQQVAANVIPVIPSTVKPVVKPQVITVYESAVPLETVDNNKVVGAGVGLVLLLMAIIFWLLKQKKLLSVVGTGQETEPEEILPRLSRVTRRDPPGQ